MDANNVVRCFAEKNWPKFCGYPENQNLEKLLFELVKATEAESTMDDIGVAPAYYGELAILYRKQKEYAKEVAFLERFAKQKHAPGAMPAKLLNRLYKAKELAVTQSSTLI